MKRESVERYSPDKEPALTLGVGFLLLLSAKGEGNKNPSPQKGRGGCICDRPLKNREGIV